MVQILRGDLAIQVDSREAVGVLQALDAALTGQSLMAFHREVTQPYLRHRAKERFASEGDDAVGGPWDELRPATWDIRESMGFDAEHPINERTGDLYNWITAGQNDIYVSARDAAVFLMPGRVGSTPTRMAKLRTAQQGRPNQVEKDPITVPRPVAAVDVTDLEVELLGLADWLFKSVRRRRFG